MSKFTVVVFPQRLAESPQTVSYHRVAAIGASWGFNKHPLILSSGWGCANHEIFIEGRVSLERSSLSDGFRPRTSM